MSSIVDRPSLEPTQLGSGIASLLRRSRDSTDSLADLHASYGLRVELELQAADVMLRSADALGAMADTIDAVSRRRAANRVTSRALSVQMPLATR